MPSLRIGQTEIAYELRRSPKAFERRIVVTPGRVEVTALSDDEDREIEGFLQRKRQWLFNTVREIEQTAGARHAVPRFLTGSKIPYRGRKMPLTVRRTDAERFEVSYRNGFVVDVPDWAQADADHLVASELRHWLRHRARREVKKVASDYRKRFGLQPRSIRVADFKGGWGSCGPEGNILVNWQVIFAPPTVLEYVVAHELCHLKVRSHGPQFWQLVATVNPSYLEAKGWLDSHQAALGDDFLTTH